MTRCSWRRTATGRRSRFPLENSSGSPSRCGEPLCRFLRTSLKGTAATPGRRTSHHLTVALGSQAELETQLELVVRLGMLSKAATGDCAQLLIPWRKTVACTRRFARAKRVLGMPLSLVPSPQPRVHRAPRLLRLQLPPGRHLARAARRPRGHARLSRCGLARSRRRLRRPPLPQGGARRRHQADHRRRTDAWLGTGDWGLGTGACQEQVESQRDSGTRPSP